MQQSGSKITPKNGQSYDYRKLSPELAINLYKIYCQEEKVSRSHLVLNFDVLHIEACQGSELS